MASLIHVRRLRALLALLTLTFTSAAFAAISPLSELSREVEALVADALPMRATVAVDGSWLDAVLIDDHGHLLVPHVLEKRSYNVTFGGEQLSASYVKADELSAMTILKLAAVPAEAEVVRVARLRPRPAELSVILSPGGGAGRLVVWDGAPREKALAEGLVIVADEEAEVTTARIAGFLCDNEFRPLDLAQVVGLQLAAGRPVERVRLGVLVGVVTRESARDTDGLAERNTLKPRTELVVLRVLPDSPAERAGVKQGDNVLAFNDRPVTNLAEFAAILADTKETAMLSILRDGVPMDLKIDLRPSSGEKPDA
ncbi:MAG: PDZ domain-containing protein [Planctomycetota bacterium]